jgi:hypothetical protein
MTRYLFIIPVLFLFLASGRAQEKELYIQLSGMVKTDLNDPIPYVSIIAKKTERSTVSDPNGLYTVIVEPLDSVFFSCVGYKRLVMTIPANLGSKHLVREVKMEIDTIMLHNVIIFPWKTYSEFKTAVLNAELPAHTEMEAAQMNIAIIQTQILLAYNHTPSMNFRNIMLQQFEKNRTYGQAPYYPIFDVVAWTKFIKALKNGEFKRKR